ncbi:MAG: hypothetical protein K2K00_11030, partial [Muribaculaceae bacterium]|nr:hypothetical protein [Muribaculaceae bacterium]
ERCREIVAKTFSRLCEKLTPAKLEAAKKQYLGQLVIASDNRENSVLAAARSLLWRGEIIAPAVTEETIKALSSEAIIHAAEPMLSPSLLTFSPQ